MKTIFDPIRRDFTPKKAEGERDVATPRLQGTGSVLGGVTLPPGSSLQFFLAVALLFLSGGSNGDAGRSVVGARPPQPPGESRALVGLTLGDGRVPAQPLALPFLGWNEEKIRHKKLTGGGNVREIPAPLTLLGKPDSTRGRVSLISC